MSHTTLVVLGELWSPGKEPSCREHLSRKPEPFASAWTHTHLGSGAQGVSGPRVPQTSRQTAADQGRRHVSLAKESHNAHAY